MLKTPKCIHLRIEDKINGVKCSISLLLYVGWVNVMGYYKNEFTGLL